jgi:hypothetical protein
MTKSMLACVLLALTTAGCPGPDHGTPPPVSPQDDAATLDKKVTDQKAHCAKISADPENNSCGACSGVSYCGWKRTTDDTTGICQWVEKKPSDDATVITDPTKCPQPK